MVDIMMNLLSIVSVLSGYVDSRITSQVLVRVFTFKIFIPGINVTFISFFVIFCVIFDLAVHFITSYLACGLICFLQDSAVFSIPDLKL